MKSHRGRLLHLAACKPRRLIAGLGREGEGVAATGASHHAKKGDEELGPRVASSAANTRHGVGTRRLPLPLVDDLPHLAELCLTL